MVKGVNFADLRDAGDPAECAARYDLEALRRAGGAVGVPVVASGGAGTLEHLREALVEVRADAALAASIFHYGQHTVREAKEFLAARGVPVRLEGSAN